MNNTLLLVELAVRAWCAVARGIAADFSIATPRTRNARAFPGWFIQFVQFVHYRAFLLDLLKPEGGFGAGCIGRRLYQERFAFVGIHVGDYFALPVPFKVHSSGSGS